MPILVRLEAIFFLPYWSWLPLIPEPHEVGTATERRKKNQALARRAAIPLISGIVLVLVWPAVYGPSEIALVSSLTAGLLLWPLLFASFYFDQVRTPPWMAWLLYALLPVIFAASGALGAVIAEAAIESGGFLKFLEDQLVSWLIPTSVILFGTALFDRLSGVLGANRRREYVEVDSDDGSAS